MHRSKIEAAQRDGQEWVLLLEEPATQQAGETSKRLEMHVDTGIAVLAAIQVDDQGRRRYFTESYFVNRNTGHELPCGSRKWNTGSFETPAQLQAAVDAAKADVYQRFAGLIAVQRRQRPRTPQGSSSQR